MIDKDYLKAFIAQAIAEDIGPGDHSSNCCIPESATGQMQLIIKADGVIAGLEVAKAVFTQVDQNIEVQLKLEDGDPVRKGDIGLLVSGPERSLLRAERLALNLMQRMSGIASKTAHLVSLIEGSGATVLDTRKTTPNLRPFEKAAVEFGGGQNHRMGLYDLIMLKDNHIDFAGGVTQAVKNAKQYLRSEDLNIPIEVETRNFDELEEVLSLEGIKRVMFDNYSVEDTARAVKMVAGKIETESSGGITATTIKDYAFTGVDYISVGALTHTVQSLDMSLKAY